MPITDLIPWKKDETSIPVRHAQEADTLHSFRNQMNRLFDEFFERPFGLSTFFDEPRFTGGFAPRMDISESDKEVTISIELPGMEPEDIRITVEHNVLRISGEKRTEQEEKGKHFYRVERSYGSFNRAISLPEGVDENAIDATFKRGVLRIKLPKTAEAHVERKRIKIKT